MTPDDERMILALTTVPGRGPVATPEQVLEHFGATDGASLGVRLLGDAVKARNGADVEMAMIASAAFGFTADHLPALVSLCTADWHTSHEDVVMALEELRSPTAVAALQHVVQWIPEYLAFDESRALATKAIHALGRTPGPDAERSLQLLLEDESDIVRDEVSSQLRRRQRS